jgi:predicted molibdopterin-dependent oxidoreductase YjgC
VNKSWLCDEGRLSFHTLERWPRLRNALAFDSFDKIHQEFEAVRKQHGDAAVAALGSATSTNEALFLMKKYFHGKVDFRLADETSNYQRRQDDLLRRVDKHPNTQGAIDLELAGGLNGLAGLRRLAESKQVRAMWIAFHPQLVGEDSAAVLSNLEALLAALEYSVVSTTHEFPWTAKASVVLPMAAWAEETGAYTNYAGRVQLTRRAVAPPGESQPLHAMMAALLSFTGVQVSPDPAAIFEWLARENPNYAGMTHESLSALGAPTLQEQEAVR